ncbi:MAG: hypothetical protein PHV43_01960 [Candidatus Colwellbacteria bacterium]|nr:hypothetical protein [Candidatus Colwellbacteria bacterium]
MFQNSSIAELVHDISFAVFRVSALVEHAFLRKELERSAVELSAYIDEEAIHRLERLLNLAQSIGEVGETNTQVLIRELRRLGNLLVSEESEEVVEADISNLFQKEEQKLPFKREKVNGKRPSQGVEPSKRQTEILNFIRQFVDGCRMADLASGFQGVSKRTLRNDIGALIDRGFVERVGSRGPYSYLKYAGGGDNLEVQPEGVSEGAGPDDIIFLSEPKTGIFDTLA